MVITDAVIRWVADETGKKVIVAFSWGSGILVEHSDQMLFPAIGLQYLKADIRFCGAHIRVGAMRDVIGIRHGVALRVEPFQILDNMVGLKLGDFILQAQLRTRNFVRSTTSSKLCHSRSPLEFRKAGQPLL